MRLLKLGALALAADSAHGYLDTSPFFMFSTSDFTVPASQLESAAQLTSSISLALSQCPSNLYIIVSQPGVTTSDYSRESSPNLYRSISDEAAPSHVRSSASVRDVVGEIDTQVWRDILESKCTEWFVDFDASPESMSMIDSDAAPGLLQVHLPSPAIDGAMRKKNMAENDARFASIFNFGMVKNYTVLYTTTPAVQEEPKEYEMGTEVPLQQDGLHVDLRRDLGRRAGGKVFENQTTVDGPLFEKYQFLTPGLFMGFTVGIILLLILYVGISALASLQVTYAAFDKEIVNAASKVKAS